MTDQCSTVFIGGASELDCQLLAASLGRNHLRVIGAASRSSEIVSAISRARPDSALISSRLQDGDFAGMGAVRELCSAQPDFRAVMLVDVADAEVVIESFRCGAFAVFSRCNGPSALRKCIHSVLEGKPWVSDAEVFCLIDAVRRQPGGVCARASAGTTSRGVSLLTRREEEIVELLLSGMTNREMATQLGLSQHTIKNYFFSIFEKIGVSTRVELLLYAMNRRKAPASISTKADSKVAMLRP